MTVQVIPIESTPAVYNTSLDGFNVDIETSYSKASGKWYMSVVNKTNGKRVDGVVMNVSIDLLASANHLDLQVIMLINREVSFSEATVDNLGSEVVLVYMDLETYVNTYFDGSFVVRDLFRLQ